MAEPSAAAEDEGGGTRLAVAIEALGPAFAARAAAGLVAACDALSALPYERCDPTGALLVCGRDHPSVDVLFELTEPVPLGSARAARKLLELSRRDVVPLSDAAATSAACATRSASSWTASPPRTGSVRAAPGSTPPRTTSAGAPARSRS